MTSGWKKSPRSDKALAVLRCIELGGMSTSREIVMATGYRMSLVSYYLHVWSKFGRIKLTHKAQDETGRPYNVWGLEP